MPLDATQKKRYGIIGALVVVAMLYWLFSSSPYEAFVKDVATAVSNRDVNAFMDHVAEDFSGATGSSKQEFRALTTAGFDAVDSLSMGVSSVEVLEEGAESAKLRIKYRLSGEYNGQRSFFVGDPLRTEDMDLHLVQRGGTWKLQSITFAKDSDNQVRRLESIIRMLRHDRLR